MKHFISKRHVIVPAIHTLYEWTHFGRLSTTHFHLGTKTLFSSTLEHGQRMESCEENSSDCEKTPRQQGNCWDSSKLKILFGMCSGLLPGVVNRSLPQILHYKWLLLFVQMPLWRTCFSHVQLVHVVVHFTRVSLLNSQSISGLML